MSDFSPLWISLKVAALAIVIIFLLGIALAYWMLKYQGRWKSLIDAFLIAPLILPPTVVGFLLLRLCGRNGPIGHITSWLGFSIVFTWYAAVISATVVAFPLMYKTTLGAFEQVDNDLLQVARTLGASERKIFWRILLPLSFPGVLAGITLAFARALGEFGATLMLAGNIPGETQTIPMAIYYAVESGQTNEGWIWVGIIMLISLSGIFAVNLSKQQRNQNFTSRATYADISNPDITQDWITPWEDRDFAISKELNHDPQSTGLYVDIQKNLIGFSISTQFSVSSNQPIGLLGTSGAGKSMLLRLIAGTEKPSQGLIVVNGKVVFDSDKQINIPARLRRVGYVVQNYALFPHMTIAENIAFGLSGKINPKMIDHKIASQLKMLHLQGMENLYPHQLSGGQQQRVAIARALAGEPDVLLLDEPFSALDTHLRNQLERQIITTLNNYDGVKVLVTHNMDEAYRICDNLLVIEKGKMIAQGSKLQIFEHPKSISVAKITGCKNFSRANLLNQQEIVALDWKVNLKISESIPADFFYVGIRAHHIKVTKEPNQVNTFICWLANQIEGYHSLTLFFKLNEPSSSKQDYHLQVEIVKDKWYEISSQSFPFYITLDPAKILLLR